MIKFKLNGRVRQAAGIFMIAVTLWVIVYAPTPLVVYEPGLAFETAPLVQRSGSGAGIQQTNSGADKQGVFLVTTIKLTDAKYWQALQSIWNKDFQIWSKDSVMKGLSEKDYLAQMTKDMLSSQNSAVEAAYRYAEIPYKITSVGLQPDDENKKIKITASDVGGPSAGLMFALQSLNLLLDQDFTRGLRIAGTGTIDKDGNVGPIGGIALKVVTADQAGAELFLAPKGNYEEAAAKAKELRSEMKVIPVTSLGSAIAAIQDEAGLTR
ncbi:S16 family serine protease [Paenibacillus sp. JDR-2]|uniref:S16 family serine protease n=1 Tax=Paenibacillus sp. (strain JDR-2) TaxID=324057 RepID=UPI000166515A|nr:S16 family serine protease [Paenibacillus sp. JDR-2]ACT02132.1 secreted protein containing a PDZ domain [Paenibacillus sp. JDR-2]